MRVVELHGQRVTVDSDDLDAAVAAELTHRGARRVMVIGSERAAAALSVASYPVSAVTIWSEVTQHVPRALVDRAVLRASEVSPDTVIAIGGGSALGLAKAIAIAKPVTLVAIPTTLAGSEVTSIVGITDEGHKVTTRNLAARPHSIIYHGPLLAQMPRQALADSAANALAHCVDARFVATPHPLIDQVAELGQMLLRASVGHITAGVATPHHYTTALMAAYWAGLCLELAGSGPHHKICHVFGGAANTPHSATHAAVLPAVWRLWERDVPDTVSSIASFAETGQPDSGVLGLLQAWGATTTLPGYVFEADVPRLVESIRSHLVGSLGEKWSDDDLTPLVRSVCALDAQKGQS